MKKVLFLLTIALVGSVWASGDVTVQVISAVHEKSLTKELNAKAQKTGLKVHKKLENGRYVLTLGTFKDNKAAQKALAMARHLVVKDAFIRPVDRQTVAVAHNVSKNVHKEEKAHKEEKVTSSATTSTPSAPSSSHAPSVVTKSVVTPTLISATPEATKVVETSAAVISLTTASKSVSDCDKREMHKNELSEAVNYYTNSPYHRFEPVPLRQ